jgi:hypothetical protein
LKSQKQLNKLENFPVNTQTCHWNSNTNTIIGVTVTTTATELFYYDLEKQNVWKKIPLPDVDISNNHYIIATLDTKSQLYFVGLFDDFRSISYVFIYDIQKGYFVQTVEVKAPITSLNIIP